MAETLLTSAPARTAKRDLTRHVLALVLAAVIFWHTVVSPSYTAAPLRATDGESPDAEEREAATRAALGFADSGAVSHAAPRSDGSARDVDELDWPEIIGDE